MREPATYGGPHQIRWAFLGLVEKPFYSDSIRKVANIRGIERYIAVPFRQPAV
jgi:hypothetical protein